MQTLGAAIRDRRQELGFTQGRLARAAECAKSYLSMIERDLRPRPPSQELLARLEQALRLEPGQLMTLGQWQATPEEVKKQVRDMRASTDAASRLAELVSERGLDELYASGALHKLVAGIAPIKGVERVGLPAQAPIINNVAAGYPREFTDLGYPARVADEYVAAPDLHDPQAFAARVIGDSMAPDYDEGDIIVFSPERDVRPGDDCFVRLCKDDETTFKRIYFERDDLGNEQIRLQPINSAYVPRTFPREDVAGLYVAVYVIRPVGDREAGDP